MYRHTTKLLGHDLCAAKASLRGLLVACAVIGVLSPLGTWFFYIQTQDDQKPRSLGALRWTSGREYVSDITIQEYSPRQNAQIPSTTQAVVRIIPLLKLLGPESLRLEGCITPEYSTPSYSNTPKNFTGLATRKSQPLELQWNREYQPRTLLQQIEDDFHRALAVQLLTDKIMPKSTVRDEEEWSVQAEFPFFWADVVPVMGWARAHFGEELNSRPCIRIGFDLQVHDIGRQRQASLAESAGLYVKQGRTHGSAWWDSKAGHTAKIVLHQELELEVRDPENGKHFSVRSEHQITMRTRIVAKKKR